MQQQAGIGRSGGGCGGGGVDEGCFISGVEGSGGSYNGGGYVSWLARTHPSSNYLMLRRYFFYFFQIEKLDRLTLVNFNTYVHSIGLTMPLNALIIGDSSFA